MDDLYSEMLWNTHYVFILLIYNYRLNKLCLWDIWVFIKQPTFVYEMNDICGLLKLMYYYQHHCRNFIKTKIINFKLKIKSKFIRVFLYLLINPLTDKKLHKCGMCNVHSWECLFTPSQHLYCLMVKADGAENISSFKPSLQQLTFFFVFWTFAKRQSG